jgi:single-strand selective monofunctional uracil DNA glycosylase
MEASGRNRTPDKLPKETRQELFAACDAALRRSIECLEPRLVIGVGNFAESRARSALEGLPVTIGRILHPSPQSPAANRDWAGTASRELREMGISLS